MTAVPAPTESLVRKARYQSSTKGSTAAVLHLEHQGDLLVLHISAGSCDSLPDAFAQAVADAARRVAPKHLVADVTACSILPSTLIAFLVFYQKTAQELGLGKVILVGAKDRIATVLKMIGMAELFVQQPDWPAARAWLGLLDQR